MSWKHAVRGTCKTKPYENQVPQLQTYFQIFAQKSKNSAKITLGYNMQQATKEVTVLAAIIAQFAFV